MYAQLPGFFNADAVAQKLRELVFGTDASRKDKLEGLDTRAVIVGRRRGRRRAQLRRR